MNHEWFKAAEGGDAIKMWTLLNRGQNVDSVDSRHRTALMLSLAHRRYEAAAFLLAEGADPDVKDTNSWSATTYAAFATAGVKVQLGRCVQTGSRDPRFRDLIEKYGGTYMLRDAIILGDAELVRDLCGKSPESIDTESGISMHGTNAMLASQMGNVGIVDILLDHGAELNATDDINRTALYTAAAEGHQALVQTLLRRGANVNHGWPHVTALSAAEENDHNEVASILLNHGAKRRLEDALRLRDSSLLVEVLRLGEYPDKWISDDRLLARAIFIAIEDDLPDFVSILLINGARINAVGMDRRSPLAHACIKGNVDIINLLLRHGADIHSVGTENKSSVEIAERSPLIMRLLQR